MYKVSGLGSGTLANISARQFQDALGRKPHCLQSRLGFGKPRELAAGCSLAYTVGFGLQVVGARLLALDVEGVRPPVYL